jgi:glutaredoxin
MNRTNLLLLMVLVALGLPAAQAAGLYKWTDSQGRVSYHDQPPPADAGYRVEEKSFDTGHKASGENGLAGVTEKYPVTLYSVPDCGACDLARAYLQKRKIPFSEQNLNASPELQQKLKKKIGSLSAPTITIGDKVMKGYMESILEGELDEVGYPKTGAPGQAPEQPSDEEEVQGDR